MFVSLSDESDICVSVGADVDVVGSVVGDDVGDTVEVVTAIPRSPR